MEAQLPQLWTYCHTIAGASAAGFIFLCGLIVNIIRSMPTAKAVENNLNESVKKIDAKIDRVAEGQDEIKKALMGDYENADFKKGLISRHFDLERRVDKLEEEKEE